MSNLDEIVNNEINYFLKFLNISFLLNADAYIDHDTHSFDKLFILWRGLPTTIYVIFKDFLIFFSFSLLLFLEL